MQHSTIKYVIVLKTLSAAQLWDGRADNKKQFIPGVYYFHQMIKAIHNHEDASRSRTILKRIDTQISQLRKSILKDTEILRVEIEDRALGTIDLENSTFRRGRRNLHFSLPESRRAAALVAIYDEVAFLCQYAMQQHADFGVNFSLKLTPLCPNYRKRYRQLLGLAITAAVELRQQVAKLGVGLNAGSSA